MEQVLWLFCVLYLFLWCKHHSQVDALPRTRHSQDALPGLSFDFSAGEEVKIPSDHSHDMQSNVSLQLKPCLFTSIFMPTFDYTEDRLLSFNYYSQYVVINEKIVAVIINISKTSIDLELFSTRACFLVLCWPYPLLSLALALSSLGKVGLARPT